MISGSVAFKFVSALKLWPGKEEFYFNIQKIPKIYGAINSTKSDRKLSSGVNWIWIFANLMCGSYMKWVYLC